MSKATARELEQELRRIGPLASKHRTAAKYRLVAEHLERVAGEFPADTRLPSVRMLAEIFGITAVPIHRAVTDLVQRGLLYAQAGRGIYVAAAQPPASTDSSEPAATTAATTEREAGPEPFSPIVVRCTLAVSSNLAHQHTFWRRAIEGFEHQYPLTRIDWRPSTKGDRTSFDMRERYSSGLHHASQAHAMLDLTDFAGGDSSAGDSAGATGGGSLRLLSPGMAPVHLNVPCLYYNKQLLARHEIAPPRFETFADQLRYFEDLPALDEAPAMSVVQPLAWLGEKVQTVLSWLKREVSPSATERHQLLEALDAMGRIRRRMRGLSPRYAFSADDFASGNLPLFHGWSYSYGYLKAQDLPFDFGVVPWLSSDDRLMALPLCVAVSTEATHYAECVRLLRHLQSPDVQRLLAATDNLPFDARFGDATFFVRDSDPAHVRALFERIYMHPVATPTDSYLSRQVINDELWRHFEGRVSAPEALDEILWLGRGSSRHLARRERQESVALAGAAGR